MWNARSWGALAATMVLLTATPALAGSDQQRKGYDRDDRADWRGDYNSCAAINVATWTTDTHKLTLTGSHFSRSARITIGGVALTNITVNASGTVLTADGPALTAGSYDVSIENHRSGHDGGCDCGDDISLAIGSGGAQGPAGPMGPMGPIGLQGPAGPAGPVGPVGQVGPMGPVGQVGQVGPVGPAGPAGPAGAVGAVGPAGPAGPVGPVGPAGANGAVGPAGPAGPQGNTGPAGPAGAAGPQGPQGLTGATGAQGPQGVAGATGAKGATGATGSQGPTGPQGPQGVAGPTGASGMRDFVDFWQPGNYTFNVPAGVTRIMLEVWGGSGGGGGASVCGGGGGGGGGYVRVILDVSPGEPFFVHVGPGGGGGASEVPFVSGPAYGGNADNSYVSGVWRSGYAMGYGGGGGQLGQCGGPAGGGGPEITFTSTVAGLGRGGFSGERSLTSGIPSPGGLVPFAQQKGGGNGAINIYEAGRPGSDGDVIIWW